MSYVIWEFDPSVKSKKFLGRFGMVSVLSLIKEKIVEYSAEHQVNYTSDHTLNDVAELVLANGSMAWSQGAKFIVINGDVVPANFNALCIETLVKK